MAIIPPGLRFLVRLCTDMGLKETQEYATKLKRVEKLKEMREQVCWVGLSNEKHFKKKIPKELLLMPYVMWSFR